MEALETILGIVIVVAIVVGIVRWRQSKGPTERISEAGAKTSDGILTCPHCGSTQFQAKRSAGAKTSLGAMGCLMMPFFILMPLIALFAPKSRVRCVACGREFRRG